jgi:uncharacterized protein YqjF (DUF2071 family)
MTSPVDDLERLAMRRKPKELPLMRQRWSRLAFLHWSVDPLSLAALLPPGLELDTWEGKAFVGIVPFAIDRGRFAFLPPLPGMSAFDEVNVRTYVHRRGRDPGVWFFSLDAASRLAVWGARAVYKLPYFPASIFLRSDAGGRTSFVSQRNGGRPRFACSYEPTSAASEARPGTEEFFLLERYLLYSWDGSYLRSARVWHHPYPMATARVGELESDELLSAAGIELASPEPPLAHYAEEVDVRIYAPSRVRARTPRLEVPVPDAAFVGAEEPALS